MYYEELYAQRELPELDFSMFDEIEPNFTLDETMKNNLVAKVTRDEIYNVLLAIDDDTTLGSDGFSFFSRLYGMW